MMTRTKHRVARARRLNAIQTVLESRRAELVQDLHHKIRDVRSGGISDRDVLDAAESSEVDIQEDIEFAMIQLNAETLKNIDAALGRIKEGTYGDCFECGAEIAEPRLRALPFAVRCRDCEQLREASNEGGRPSAQRRDASLLLLDPGS